MYTQMPPLPVTSSPAPHCYNALVLEISLHMQAHRTSDSLTHGVVAVWFPTCAESNVFLWDLTFLEVEV